MTDNQGKGIQYPNKTEKLLACLEAIDDDIIDEAAQAVSNASYKKTKPYWLTWGNVAAVFIGAVAVSCVLMLAFWLSSAGMGEVPADSGNGGSGYHTNGNGDNGYNENGTNGQPPSPTPDSSIQASLLPLPIIHDTWDVTILEAGRTHMTINNPWHDAGHIESLPVFLSVLERDFGDAEQGVQYTSNLSDEDWEWWEREILYMASWIAIFSGISTEDAESRRPNNMFMEFIPQGLDVFMHMDLVSSVMHLSFPDNTVALPAGASFSEAAPQEEIQAAIEYLAELFAFAIQLDTPTLAQPEIALDMGGPRSFYRQRFFDAGGSPLDAILAFNFQWVEVITFHPDMPQWMHVSTFPQGRYDSLQMGSFPIITAEEAREMLLQGYFISQRLDTQWPGRELALTASVELVYHNSHGIGPIMPFYRFLIETDLPLWMANEPGDWQAFARYYVPAVHRDYLEPMTRRQTPEPLEAPAGPRALPPSIFRYTQSLSEDLWVPLRLERHQVEELWQEVLNDIGPLAPNEGYQFRTACGLYAMIAGTRTLASREELLRYYPGLDLPERVGDFTLREIYVNDRSDFMIIFNRPMSTYFPMPAVMATPANHGNPPPPTDVAAPIGEIFIRAMSIEDTSIASAFYAVYEHPSGIAVGLGVSSLFFDLLSGIREPYTVLDMGEYGLIYFPSGGEAYYNNLYYKAMFEYTDPWLGFGIELWFHHGSIDGRFNYLDMRYSYDRVSTLFTPVSRGDLEELVRVFNPRALAWEYQWGLMSWQ